MTRDERKAWQARAAVGVLAIQAAKRAVKASIRAQGLQLGDFTAKEITLRAEAMLAEHPELISQAKVTAVELGFAPPQNQTIANQTEIANDQRPVASSHSTLDPTQTRSNRCSVHTSRPRPHAQENPYRGPRTKAWGA